MNRLEAYELISKRLQQLEKLELEQLQNDIGSGLTEISKSCTGTSYEMNFKLNGNKLEGNIHEFGSQKFVLLEESIVLAG